jgi:pimeloyl-ACP methyl ester carboxylesterase
MVGSIKKSAPPNPLTEPTRWIFLRGLARHSAHWGPFADVFKRRFPLAQVSLIDAAGNGTEQERRSFLSIEENVEDLRRRISAKDPVFIFSISLGSMVATSWAAHFPEETSGLVLINTSDKGTSRFYERLRPENYRHILSIVTRSKDNCLRENKIMAMTAGGFPDAEKWVAEFAKLPSTSFPNFVRQLWAGSRYEFPKEKPDTQILLLASRRDQLVNSVCTERIAQQWKLTPQFHPRAGHDLPLWAPDWVCDQIEAEFGRT